MFSRITPASLPLAVVIEHWLSNPAPPKKKKRKERKVKALPLPEGPLAQVSFSFISHKRNMGQQPSWNAQQSIG